MNRKIFNRLTDMLKASPQLLLDNNLLGQAIAGEFDVNIDVANNDIVALTNQIDEAVLERYFSQVWQPETKKYKYSGLSIIDQVNALNPDAVLDLGCGYNEFKGKIQNLTGVDPYNHKADEIAHTLDYVPNKQYDVVICLGSINFGSADKIFREVQRAVELTKTGGLIIFRANPGIQHHARESQWIDFFEWDTTFIVNTAAALGCRVNELHYDIAQDNSKLKNGGRFYFVYEKL